MYFGVSRRYDRGRKACRLQGTVEPAVTVINNSARVNMFLML